MGEMLCAVSLPASHATGFNFSVNTVLTSERERKKAKETGGGEEVVYVKGRKVQRTKRRREGCFLRDT